MSKIEQANKRAVSLVISALEYYGLGPTWSRVYPDGSGTIGIAFKLPDGALASSIVAVGNAAAQDATEPPPMHALAIQALSLPNRNEYQFGCMCGEHGEWRATRGEANEDGQAHIKSTKDGGE